MQPNPVLSKLSEPLIIWFNTQILRVEGNLYPFAVIRTTTRRKTMKAKTQEDMSEVTDIAASVHNLVEGIVITTVSKIQADGNTRPPCHLYVCLAAAAGALTIAAKIMSAPEGIGRDELKEWAGEPATRDSVLAASLLLARCSVPCNDGLVLEYSPINIRAALDAMTKVTGNPDHSMLTKQMVEAAANYSSPGHFFDNTRGATIQTSESHTIQ
jgi:hypothetical protein